MAFPKIIDFFGVKVPVDSWAELREAISELGPGGIVSEDTPSLTLNLAQGPSPHVQSRPNETGLSSSDRTLLVQFIENSERGLLTSQLAHAMGKKGKGVRPALERWSRRINLVTEEGASAFEAIKRFDGRGFRMVEHYRRAGAAMLKL